MADAQTQELLGQSKPFTVPQTPTAEAISSQFGGLPVAPEYSKKLAGLKTSKQVAGEEAKQLEQAQKLGQEIGATEQAQKEYLTQAKADIASQYRAGAQQIESGLEKTRAEFPYPEFHPTKENMTDLATMFSLIGVIGMAMGGSGKMSAIGSLNSMSGMMKGWQQGRKDIWEKEKQEYEKNMQRVKSVLDDAYKDADRAMKTLAYNRDEATALAEASAAKMGGQIGRQILEKQGVESYYKFLTGVKKDLQHSEEMLMKAEEHRKDRAQREQHHQDQMTIDKMRMQATKDKNILPMIQGVRSIENLQDQLRDPEVQSGLRAKVAPLLEKLKSVDQKADFEQAVNSTLTGTDKTTIFLKDALMSSYEIERAAAGGGRLTVEMMRRAGPVLDPTNYTAQTYNGILEGRRKTLYNNLQDLGYTPEAIKQVTAPHAYAPYGVEEKERPFHWEYNEDKTKRRKVYD